VRPTWSLIFGLVLACLAALLLWRWRERIMMRDLATASKHGAEAALALPAAKDFAVVLGHPTAFGSSEAQAGLARVEGFNLDRAAPALQVQGAGSRIRHREPGKTGTDLGRLPGLTRIEVFPPGEAAGVAVMVPLAPGEGCTIEFRPRDAAPPHPHIVFDDLAIERMLRYRREYELEASAAVAASLLTDKSITTFRPIAAALSLYVMLRTSTRDLAMLADHAGALLGQHGSWLPDAHVIAGEIAGRQERHRAALEHLLGLDGIGPPFAAVGVTYLSDRLGLYGRHLETELSAPELRQSLDPLQETIRLLARRLIATRPVTTFHIGVAERPPAPAQ
jgi:hypothetical protein